MNLLRILSICFPAASRPPSPKDKMMVNATVPKEIPKARFIISSASPIVLNPIAKKMAIIATLMIDATKALSSFFAKLLAATEAIQFPKARIISPKIILPE